MRHRWITDFEPSERWPIYTRANADEVLPDPCTPLGWSLVWEQGLIPGWYDGYVQCGVVLPREHPKGTYPMVGSFGGYLYNNLSYIRTWASRLPGSSVEAADRAFIGGHPELPPYVPHPNDADPDAVASASEGLNQALAVDDLPKLNLERDQAEASRAERPELRSLSATHLVERARRLLPLARATFSSNVVTGVWSSVGPGMLASVAAALGDDDWSLELIAGLGDVDSAQSAYATWELSRMVAGSDELTKVFDDGVDGLLGTLRESGSSEAERFLRAFDDFVLRFGSRGPNEWDIGADVWETAPELALRHVDRARFVQDNEGPWKHHKQQRDSRERLIAKLTARVEGNDELAGLLTTGLRASRVYFVGRERAKTNAVKVVHEVRMAIRELGRQAAESGFLTHPRQVMMLLADELDSFVTDPGEYSSVLDQREREYRDLFQLEPPYFVDHVVPPLSEWSRRDVRTREIARSGEVLTGVAGSPGIATGRARVVLDPEHDSELEPQEILVAPTTDPSWTPLFLSASAVVVNAGALNSHAVIVSRELGIPCVPSVSDATLRIPDGATLTVDGSRGTVTVH